MALELTENTISELDQTNLSPIIVLEIEGYDVLLGSDQILKKATIGSDLIIGEFTIGGSVAVGSQEPLISFTGGTTTSIRQTLKQDKGVGSTVTSMRINLVDKDGEISKLITPGEEITDLLGARAKVWYGFKNTNWRQDFQVIHRGVIDDIQSGAGSVLVNIASPQQLERGEIFIKAETELTGAMGAGDTVANVDSTANFLEATTGPTGVRDLSLKFYLKINDELMEYDAKNSPTQFGATLTRGALGTTAAAHSIGDTVESFYRLEGNSMDLALKLLLSGTNGDYAESISITNFVRLSPTETLANSILFTGLDLEQIYNVREGDYVTTTGSANPGSNDVSLKVIESLTVDDNGTTLVIGDGVSFVEENSSSATISFRSQWDTLGEGAKLIPDEVDIQQFVDIKGTFLSTFNYDIYLDDTIDSLKDFLGQQIYLPAGAYSLPRKARSSVGIHQGPLPTINIKTLDTDSIKNPGSLKVTRTTNKNFYNAAIHNWEFLANDPERSIRSRRELSVVSTSQIKVNVKPITIDAKGMRDLLSAETLAEQAQDRILRKYKFAAETIKGVKVNLKTAFDVEIGDILSLDMASIKATDIKNAGSRDGLPRLFEVENKTFNLKGEGVFDLVDTNFSNDTRFCVFSPSSKISKDATSQTNFIIKASYFTGRYGNSEFRKWTGLIGAKVQVRNSDYTTLGTATLQSISGNSITVDAPLGFLPLEDYIMELDSYDNQPDFIKLVFGFWTDETNNFGDGGIPYQWY